MKLENAKLTPLDDLKSMQVHEYQRQIVTRKVKHYMDSMRENGFWKSHPIVWFRHQGKRMIIWGHHRRAAAVALKISAWTQEAAELTMEESIALIATENWSTWSMRETVMRECRRENPHYITLKEYVDQGLTIKAASSLLRGTSAGSGGYLEAVKLGTFTVKSTEQADIIVGLIRATKASNPEVSNTHFIAALSRCLFVPEFDVSLFQRRLISNPGILEKRSNVQDFSREVERIYNFRSKSPLPVSFLADRNAAIRQKRESAGSVSADGKEAEAA